MQKIFFLSLLLLSILTASIFSQSGEKRTTWFSPGTVHVNGQDIPVYKGVQSVNIDEYSAGIVEVSYNKEAKSLDLMWKDQAAISKFYTGKTIFGVPVGKFAPEPGNIVVFKQCGGDTEPNLHITIGPNSGGYQNGVTIRNKCP